MPLRSCLLSAGFLILAISRGVSAPRGAATQVSSCAPEEAERVRISRISPQGDAVLVDGRVVAIVGVDFAMNDAAAHSLMLQANQADLRFASGDDRPDRWGRRRGALFLAGADEADRRSIAELALEAGLGRYRPDPAVRACRPRLLAAEQQARSAGLGVWSESGVIDAADRQAVAAAAPGFAIVEGVIVDAGEAGSRLYLNFGKIRTVDLAIVIARRDIAEFEQQLGLRAADLIGRRVRTRGLIDRRFGPTMEASGPDAIELVESGRSDTAAVGTEGRNR